jgi:ketosteroid isomerase-like protein
MGKARVTVVITGLLAVLWTSPVVGDDVADLKAAHAQALKALVTGDVDLWLASLHDEQVRFNRGSQQPTDYKGIDRATLRKEITAGYANMERYSITPVDLQYRVIGDTGLVWGHNVDSYKDKGSPGTVTISRITAVYARTDGKWLRVLTHISALPPAE